MEDILLNLGSSPLGTGNAGSTTTDRNYPPLFQRLPMPEDNILNYCYSLGHPYIGQPHQASVSELSPVNQFSEILIQRIQHPSNRSRHLQEDPVSRIRINISRIYYVMSVIVQPFGQLATSATIHNKLHEPVTEIDARVSPAMTVWAYAMQARISSGSNAG